MGAGTTPAAATVESSSPPVAEEAAGVLAAATSTVAETKVPAPEPERAAPTPKEEKPEPVADAATEPMLNVISTDGASTAKPDQEPGPEPAGPTEPVGPAPPGQRFGPDGRPIRITAKYVLVGSGTASYFALRGIREKDPEAKVVIIGEEDEIPYMRT